jgi:hypothetical protein
MPTLHHRSARGYAKLGLPACPVLGKAPAYCDSHGWGDATDDYDDLDRLFLTRRHTGVGIATGQRSGVWVLDIDGPAGLASIRDLIAHHGRLPRGPVARTGGGGWHLWFRWSSECERLRNRVAFLPGLDVRTTGGGAVVPPSLHESGRRYEWRAGASPYDLEFPLAPGWLLDTILASYPTPTREPIKARTNTVTFADRRVEAALRSAEDKIADAMERQRPNLWYQSLCIGRSIVATGDCDKADAAARLVKAGLRMKNTKPRKWTKTEIATVVEDGLEAGIAKAGGSANAA